jgi:hypothetical protein
LDFSGNHILCRIDAILVFPTPDNFFIKTPNYCILESWAPETVTLTGDGGNHARGIRNIRVIPLGIVRGKKWAVK